VLVRVPVSPSRFEARREARTVLRTVLAAWSGLPPDQLPLDETPRGPLWRGEPLGISLSYGAGEAWIGLLRGGRIGVDVMRVELFAELHEVAQTYLDPSAAGAIRQAPDPARAFAAAWTAREAALKCAQRGLTEWASGALPPCETETVAIGADVVGAVARQALPRGSTA
jgi:4'-phosphopantetheinyl transferase